MEIFRFKDQAWEGTYNMQTDSEPFSLIKENSFNREKSNRLKNFMLRMEGWAVFTFSVAYIYMCVCMCVSMHIDSYKGRSFASLAIEEECCSFVKTNKQTNNK